MVLMDDIIYWLYFFFYVFIILVVGFRFMKINCIIERVNKMNFRVWGVVVY